MRYVYLLQSEAFAGQRYIGITSDPRKRIAEHNGGRSPHTSKYAPWTLVTYVAFSDERKAETFELYLKSGSGQLVKPRMLDSLASGGRDRTVVRDEAMSSPNARVLDLSPRDLHDLRKKARVFRSLPWRSDHLLSSMKRVLSLCPSRHATNIADL